MSFRDRFLSHKLPLILSAVCLVIFVCGLFVWLKDITLIGLILAGCGFAFFIVMSGIRNLSVTDTRAEATERTLRIATETLSCLQGGLSEEPARTLCSILLPESGAEGIAITDTTTILAHKGLVPAFCKSGAPVSSSVRMVLESNKIQTFTDSDAQNSTEESDTGKNRVFTPRIIVPLTVQNRTQGTLIFYYRRIMDVNRTQTAVAEGLGALLSTQLSSYELERQAELTIKAEIKALQAQINPHFLFNVLNTIASFTRTSPTRARELLQEFSFFYRRVLESSEKDLIPLSQELLQVKSYLKIERARFGDSRIVEQEHILPACMDILVPSFLIQPLVENSIHHALRDEGVLCIDIQATLCGCDMLISVVDDGLGMDEEDAGRLLDNSATSFSESSLNVGVSSNAGMALHNVAERVRRFYGPGSGVEIISKPKEGTCVTLILVGALEMHDLVL